MHDHEGHFSLVKFLLRHLALWSLLFFVAYLIWLDYKVGQSFANRQWAVPARLFASPLELYSGMRLDPSDLEMTLRQLGYDSDTAYGTAGTFTSNLNGLTIHSRGHRFPDGAEPARSFDIRFTNGVVTSLVDTSSGDPLALARLEPVEIGRINPNEFEDRVLLSIADTPSRLLKILLAVEDRRFYSHIGVDPIGIARAVISNLTSGSIEQGASTITQQLVKNLYLSNRRTYGRKIREALMAISLERQYDKDEIVEAYLNEIFLGQDGNRAIHGFALGAKFYFGKEIHELSLAESATLVGMVKAPSAYNPIRNPDAAKSRRDLVLDLLLKQGLITGEEHFRATMSPIPVRNRALVGVRSNTAFIDLVHAQLKRDYRDEDLKQVGLNVYTTLDLHIQQVAQSMASRNLAAIEMDQDLEPNSLESAVVVIDPRTAELRALVGSREAFNVGFNRALNARRSIGSLVKPFVYLAALEQTRRFNVLSALDDKPIKLTGADGVVWSPSNYDGKPHGKISLRDALVRSYNLATVNLGMKIGVGRVIRRLQKSGLAREVHDFPSLLLGAIELSPIEVASLYQVIANDGYKVPLRAIRSVADAQNSTLTRYGPRVEQVIEAAPAYLLQYLLTRVVTEGTANAAALALPGQLPLAGKTGTSNDGRDSWFAGFSENFLSVIWIGRDDNGKTGLTGASGALRLWTALMRQIGATPFRITQPEGLQFSWVTPTGIAILPAKCRAAVRIPLALPHGLPIRRNCDETEERGFDLWGQFRGLFH